ncbi:MAG: hypothetical protein AB8G14_11145, partial [Ilumatobacter sp.]
MPVDPVTLPLVGHGECRGNVRLDDSLLLEELAQLGIEFGGIHVHKGLDERRDPEEGDRRANGVFFVPPIICTAVYAMTDFGGYFWPMWVWFGCMIPVAL